METLVVSGALANKHLNGGEAWVRLSWILGLRRLGFDVWFVEQMDADTAVDAAGRPVPFGESENLRYFEQVVERFGLSGRASLLCDGGREASGVRLEDLLPVADEARLLVNISGHLDLEPLMARLRRKAYVDLDPGFTQFWHADGTGGSRLEGHDVFFTVGENIGRPGCAIPTCGLDWKAVRPPVVLDEWPVADGGDPDRFTTIGAWRGAFGPVTFGDRTYSLKVHQFRKVLDLPRRAPQRFEIALDIHPGDERDREALEAAGWTLADPRAVVPGPVEFRDYVQGSGAEFSVAQGIYVETSSGWFSDRTVRYLAAGRPVLVQDTGFSQNLPSGDGLLAFDDLEGAVAGVQRIAADYEHHRGAARAVAETHFDSDTVLARFLEEAGDWLLTGKPARRGVTRMEIAVAAGVLLALTGIFVAIAVVSTRWLIEDESDPSSDLPPLALIGSEETVFDHSEDACSPNDVPDAAARAFRDAEGRVHLIASHHVTRAMVGPSLDGVRHECRRVMVSGYDPDPARFDDREWLTSPYTTDGRTVYALVHNEYQGYNHPGRCTSEPLRCWYNSITLARSTDGGNTFTQAPSPRHLVAAVPYRYEPDQQPYGLFQPSNVIHRPDDRHFYAVLQAEPFRAQRPGTCVMRTPRLDRPAAWRGWDGQGFNVRFVNPYEQSGGTENVCTPVSFPEIGKMTGSLTYNTYLDRYVLVSPNGKQLPGRRGVTWGFYYSTSEDLVRWKPRRLIREAVLTSSYRCGDANPVGYPSLLDTGSRSRNFETTGREAWLYFTRFHYKDCRNELDRDLVRIRVRFSR